MKKWWDNECDVGYEEAWITLRWDTEVKLIIIKS